MHRWLILLPLLVGACTVPDTPVPPVPPVQERLVFLPNPPECVDVIQLATLVESPMPPAMTRRPPPRPVKVPTPEQLVQDAQRAARVVPTDQGFFGGSAEYTYAWQPGKVYTIYLSPTQPTGLFLPPGETMVSGLLLNAEQYEVKAERAGTEPLAYDAITIRPTGAKGDIDTFILTTSGKRFLLHLSTGRVGMLAVTFEVPHIHHEAPEPRLVLPRPTP
jgi:hypothetical protein